MLFGQGEMVLTGFFWHIGRKCIVVMNGWEGFLCHSHTRFGLGHHTLPRRFRGLPWEAHELAKNALPLQEASSKLQASHLWLPNSFSKLHSLESPELLTQRMVYDQCEGFMSNRYQRYILNHEYIYLYSCFMTSMKVIWAKDNKGTYVCTPWLSNSTSG